MTILHASPLVADSHGTNASSHKRYSSQDVDKIRLLKFMTRFGIGGTEKQVVNLSKRLNREAFDLRFGALRRLGILAEEIESDGFTIDEYPVNHLYGYRTLQRQWQLSHALRRDQIQIMHSYNFYSNVFSVPAARLARTPCIIASVRDMGVNLTLAQLKVHSLACRMADIVLVNAYAIRDWMIGQGIPERKLRVIHNGVDIKKFAASSDGSAFRRELGIPPQAPIVTMLSRMEANKGVEYFLRAAPGILERCPDVHFVAVGDIFEFDKNADAKPDTLQQSKLVRRADELGIGDRIHFIGERSDVPEILAATTISVLPSDSEGLSNTLLESMAAGAVVVATNVGGTPELIRDGKEGLLVPPRDSRAIANAVGSILEDPFLMNRLGSEGKKRVETSFSFDEMTRRTEALYFELVESRRRYKSKRKAVS